ncbi:HXXEE domain-containing protein [Brevibacillus composti]|uniref:HXXEE domain-containing protein n=1 Tax=Brevibacillus composti TaxID=2796470 RepID=A0A7T5ELZ8_9BACL|nr:HXXEE domain-containing protein [Brevibacillus composti]QQE75064.1 HXXEE domain-containing protein [Brevibacillus composti]QUO42150.1 HXXEE domain-containing protein [Brevibacillus composti]
MISLLDSAISTHSLIWLFLAAFMLHDFEEIIRIEPWYRRHYERIIGKVPHRFRRDVQAFSRMTSSQFAVAVCLEFLVFIPVTYMAADQGTYLWFLGFNAVLLLHVFMHIGQALYLKMLVPGVVTAVGITFPYSIYLFYRLLSENLVELSDILISLPLGLALLPIVLLGHKLGERLIPSPAASGE